MVFEVLQPGLIVEGDELIAPLNPYHRFMPTWKARGANGDVVLRFLSGYTLARVPEKDIEPLMNLPPIPGFIPWTGWALTRLGKHSVILIRRPYFPARLIDRFPADPANPPSAALLESVRSLATTFDTLQQHHPSLNFDLSPGNLLLDGDTPLLVDCGLAHHVHFADMDARAPVSRHVEPERGAPLSAAYPSMWMLWAATRSPYEQKIERTDAQYALAALYVYLRTGILVFEDPADLWVNDGAGADATPHERLLVAIRRMNALHDSIQAYEEHGTLLLPMLSNQRERAVVSRALSRDDADRYPSCVAFVETLRRL